MESLTRLERALKVSSEKRHVILERLEEFDRALNERNISGDLEPRDIHEIWGMLVRLSKEFSTYIELDLQCEVDIEKHRIAQYHTIGRTNNRRMSVSKECIRKIWNELEDEDGYARAVVCRKSGSITTFLEIDKLFGESNSGSDEIEVLAVKRRGQFWNCEISWSTQSVEKDGIRLRISGSRDFVEQMADRIESILSNYETGYDLFLNGRRYIFLFIVVMSMIIVISSSYFGLENTIEDDIARSLISGILGTVTGWCVQRAIFKVGRIVDLEIGRGKARADWNRRFRNGGVTVAVSALPVWIVFVLDKL